MATLRNRFGILGERLLHLLVEVIVAPGKAGRSVFEYAQNVSRDGELAGASRVAADADGGHRQFPGDTGRQLGRDGLEVEI